VTGNFNRYVRVLVVWVVTLAALYLLQEYFSQR
jgi:hypothetical protein